MQVKRMKRLVAELKKDVRDSVPFSLTFQPTGRMTKAQVAELEGKLKHSFELWANSWVVPKLDELADHLDGKDLKTGIEF